MRSLFTLSIFMAGVAVAAPPDADQEHFLSTAGIVTTTEAPGGITKSKRVTLSDGALTHDAHVQTINHSQAEMPSIAWLQKGFIDAYTGNVAAYKLDRLLGLNMTPVSVERKIDGIYTAVTWWVDNVLCTGTERHEKKLTAPDPVAYREQGDRMKIFDELIGNKDRNSGNVLITKDWQLVMIDHTRAFTWGNDLMNPGRLQRCDRHLLAAIKALDKKTLKKTLGPRIKGFQIDSMLKRRDLIVEHFEKLAAEKGEAEVYYGETPTLMSDARH